jgi:asparagine synthase (glutamine-hydrolysing)
LRLAELDLAAGFPFGSSPDAAAFATAPSYCIRAAMERAILPALLRPPCLVSFSGGRDSSAVLAVATRLARKTGLPTPIPVTLVFPELPATDETSWQEQVLRALGVSDWMRLEHGDELDLIGPHAGAVLHRHGVLWPFNVHMHVPMLRAADGGSLLTGLGGDDLFDAAERARLAAVRARVVRPERRDLVRLAAAVAPRRVRGWALAVRDEIEREWLRPRARRQLKWAYADWKGGEPAGLRDRLGWAHGNRYLATARASLNLLARDEDTAIAHPLLDVEVWKAVAAAAAPIGFAHRTDGMRRLFGDLLPDEICARGSKAQFQDVLWTDRVRAFAAEWDGSGLPSELVDAEALSRHWRSEAPSALSFALLQAAWLASSGRFEQPLDGLVEALPAAGTAELQER